MKNIQRILFSYFFIFFSISTTASDLPMAQVLNDKDLFRCIVNGLHGRNLIPLFFTCWKFHDWLTDCEPVVHDIAFVQGETYHHLLSDSQLVIFSQQDDEATLYRWYFDKFEMNLNKKMTGFSVTKVAPLMACENINNFKALIRFGPKCDWYSMQWRYMTWGLDLGDQVAYGEIVLENFYKISSLHMFYDGHVIYVKDNEGNIFYRHEGIIDKCQHNKTMFIAFSNNNDDFVNLIFVDGKKVELNHKFYLSDGKIDKNLYRFVFHKDILIFLSFDEAVVNKTISYAQFLLTYYDPMQRKFIKKRKLEEFDALQIGTILDLHMDINDKVILIKVTCGGKGSKTTHRFIVVGLS